MFGKIYNDREKQAEKSTAQYLSPDAVKQGYAGGGIMDSGINNTRIGNTNAMPVDGSGISPNTITDAATGIAAATGTATPSMNATTMAIPDPATASAEDLANYARYKEAKLLTDDPKQAMKMSLSKIDLSDPNVNMDWVKGFELAKDRNESIDRLQMDKQKNAGVVTDRFQAQQTMEGMRDAANQGGYQGVLDYLSLVDPERALKMHKDKLDLDSQIMKNEVAEAALPGQKMEALAGAYGALGKMGYALLKANPEDRDNMYQQMKPMVKLLNPNASETLDKNAINMFMLSASQSVPENILYGSMKNNAILSTQLGKLASARDQAQKEGNLQLANDFQKQYDGTMANSQKEQSQAAEANLKVIQQRNQGSMSPKDILQANENSAKSLRQILNPTINNMKDLTGMRGLTMQIEENGGVDNPKNAAALNMFRIGMARTVQKGTLTEQDYQRSGGTASWQDWQKKLLSYETGTQQPLNKTEWNVLNEFLKGSINRNYNAMRQTENQYGQMVDQHTYTDGQGNVKPIVDPKTISLNSTQFDSYYAPNSTLANTPKPAPASAQLFVKQNPNALPDFIKKYGYNPQQQQQDDTSSGDY